MANSNKKPDEIKSAESAAEPIGNAFSKMFNNPMGNLPTPPGVNMPPYGANMPGMPGMPPMPGAYPPAGQSSAALFSSVGNMLRLGVDTLNAVLAGSNQVIQAFMGGGHHSPYYYDPYGPFNPHHGYGGHHCGGHHCCGHHHHDHYHDSHCHSCCDVYGEHCCNPSVNGCD